MHRTPVDLTQAVSTAGQTGHRKVHHRLPFELGKKLGE